MSVSTFNSGRHPEQMLVGGRPAVQFTPPTKEFGDNRTFGDEIPAYTVRDWPEYSAADGTWSLLLRPDTENGGSWEK